MPFQKLWHKSVFLKKKKKRKKNKVSLTVLLKTTHLYYNIFFLFSDDVNVLWK